MNIFSADFWTGTDPYKVRGPSDYSKQARFDQAKLAEQLRKRSMGRAPSAAETMMKHGMANAMNQSSGMLAAQRGLNPALAARMAMRAHTQQTADMGGQMAALRAKEQALAEQQLAQLLQGQRALDINEWSTQQQINARQQPGSQGFLGNVLGTALDAAAALATGGMYQPPPGA